MATRLPPMQALRAFEAAARERSLTRAAESLHLTHGAISHQIKSLEHDLGVRLVERAGRGIRLTDDGERFAARVRAAFAELMTGVHEITSSANPRLLRVSVVPSFAARWLLPRIGHFIAMHPGIDLDVRASLHVVDFRHDDADVAIRFGQGPWPGVTAEHLMDDAYVPVCSPRIAGGVPGRPEDLARYTLLRADDEPWKPWFERAGLDWPEPSRGPIFHDSSHMLQAAAEGHGVALARVSLLGDDVRNGILLPLFSVEAPAAKRFFLVYPPRSAGSEKLDAFRQWLNVEIEANRMRGRKAARAGIAAVTAKSNPRSARRR